MRAVTRRAHPRARPRARGLALAVAAAAVVFTVAWRAAAHSDGAAPVLWLSGGFDSVVYAISTTTALLLAKIPVGASPHGLCVWPQPGRYSLGHTGITR